MPNFIPPIVTPVATSCNIPNTNPLDLPCVTPVPTVTSDASGGCAIDAALNISCPTSDTCSPFSLTNVDETQDSCFIDGIIAESLEIGGAIINVYKLLGIYEQGKLVDLTGNGTAISKGDIPNYPASNAFDKYITEWRSAQLGSNILSTAYIGYDFGQIKLVNGRNRYGIETFIKVDVATIKLKQGCNSQNRVTQVRVERSSDGTKWYGVATLNVPDCDGLVTLNFKRTVPSRWWRIRPLAFNGGQTDWWSVQALQFIDYEVTALDNIEDRIFLENRDRNYSTSPIVIKGSYTPLSLQTFQSKFGMSQLFGGQESYSIEISFSSTVAALTRPLVIGDVIELPSETQYSPTLKPIKKYLEITDTAWSVNGYTPNWKPTLVKIIAQPVIASQETQDLFGKLTEDVDSSGLIDINNGDNSKQYQDQQSIAQTITAEANTNVPERGEDYANVTKLSDNVFDWAKQYPEQLTKTLRKIDRHTPPYGVDAMPPNGLPFSEGDQFPPNPKNGDYHRLTYTFINNDIPPRLNRYSATKGRWIFLQTDHRFAIQNTKPVLQEFLNPETSSLTNPHDTDNITGNTA